MAKWCCPELQLEVEQYVQMASSFLLLTVSVVHPSQHQRLWTEHCEWSLFS